LRGIKAGQVFAVTDNGDGTILLCPVKPDRKARFPKGSLLKYITPERDAEMSRLAKGTVIGVPADAYPDEK